MTADSNLTKDLLREAIVAEADGQKFYKYLADKATNEEAKSKLMNLAKDEIRHEATLIDIYRKIFHEEVDTLPEKGTGVLSVFFAEHRDKKDLGEMQYVDMAIEAELAATEFYKTGAESATDEKIKAICEQLAEEEFSHYEALKAEREALTGNYFWFGFDESSPMES